MKCPLCRKVTTPDQIIVGVDKIDDGWTTVTSLLASWASRQKPETAMYVARSATSADRVSEEAEDLNASSDEDADEGIRAVSLESDATEDGAEGAQIVGATGGVAETSSEDSDDDDDEPVEVDPPAPSARQTKGRAVVDSDDSDAVADAPVASTSSQAGKLTADKRAELLAKKRKSRF